MGWGKADVVILTSGRWFPHSLQRRHRAIIADGHPMESDTFFRVHWNCGKITLQSPNGRFLSIASNGLLMSNVTIPGEPSHSPPSLAHITYKWTFIFVFIIVAYVCGGRMSTEVRERPSGIRSLGFPLSLWVPVIEPGLLVFGGKCFHTQDHVFKGTGNTELR